MNFGPITLFQRMHSNGKAINSFVLASLHWRASITWRWSLSWSPWYQQGVQGFTFRRHFPMAKGLNFYAGLNSRLTGKFSIETQPNMFRAKPTRKPTT